MANLTLKSTLPMNTGYEIPRLGFGVYQTPAEICEDVVTHALKVGYRHIDSAAEYHNEAPCAEAMRKSGIPRSEIFFTSKIRPSRTLNYEDTKKQVDESLSETGLDYIDLMLIHAPYGGIEGRKGAWKALAEAQADGKLRSIGVSNYGIHHLNELEQYMKELELEGGKASKISVGQWELHPWINRSEIAQWCQERGIVLEAYSPLMRAQRFQEESLQGLVKKHGRTPAQILVRWSLQRGFVPLPKSVTLSRIEENADVYNFELTEEEVEHLQTTEYSPCTWDPTQLALEQ